MTSRKCEDWIKTYIEYTSEQESPTLFHKWTAIAALSATLGRHVFLNRGYYTIFPNLYVVLVAGSAKCKKSTSTSIGINLLRELTHPPMVFSQKITNEALIAALQESKQDNQCAGIVYASELSVFMGSDAVRSGLIPTLTDLYDSPERWRYHTRGRGEEVLCNVTVSMLAASTSEWLRICIPSDAVGGGFTSRIIFVFQDRPSKAILFPNPSSTTLSLKHVLLHDLNHIREQRGEIILTDSAKTVATEWYKKEMGIIHDVKLEGYFGRKHDTLFKLAAILSLARSDDRIIREQHFVEALELLNETESHLPNIVSSFATTETGNLTDRVLEIIRREEGIVHSELLKKCWRFATSVEMQMHIKTLVEGELISEEINGHNQRIYRAKAPKSKPVF